VAGIDIEIFSKLIQLYLGHPLSYVLQTTAHMNGAKIQLDIVALSHSVTQTHNYAVVLGEQDGARRLPIVIGGFEAQAIAVAMERMTPNRPLTHDLFKNTLETYQVELQEVIISKLIDGIFHAKLMCLRNGALEEIDSRTSDALALAVRFECPIYTYESILEAAGVILEDSDGPNRDLSAAPSKGSSKPVSQTQNASLTDLGDQDLQDMLNKVLEEEDYEQAAKIRDELNRRTANES